MKNWNEKMNLSSVPVIMYHSVKHKVKKEWVHPHITLTLRNFWKHVKFFSTLRIKTYFLDDLYNHFCCKTKLSNNTVILTFDDGYLDNYTFVFPLLRKYKLKATIWVNPEFIKNDDIRIRPTLEDYWNNKISLEELNQYDGFLNWEEMRLMEKSGYVEIQSHTLTHTKYPVSEKIIDFVSPNTKLDWLYWNLFPEDKSNFLTTPKFKIPLGYPIYESQKGNIAVKYQEDGTLTKSLIDFVKSNGGEKFFTKSSWKETLFNFAKNYKQKNKVYYIRESEEEYIKRITYELKESKRIIEENLNKQVNHVCWPFGGFNEITKKIAYSCGYLTTTSKGGKNIFGKKEFNSVDRITLDNSRYQNMNFYFYAFIKFLKYKL